MCAWGDTDFIENLDLLRPAEKGLQLSVPLGLFRETRKGQAKTFIPVVILAGPPGSIHEDIAKA